MSALHSGHLGRSTSFSEVGAIDLNRPRWRTARSVGGSGEPPLPASEKLQREQRVTKMSPCICTIFSFGSPARACRSSTFCVTSRNSSACHAVGTKQPTTRGNHAQQSVLSYEFKDRHPEARGYIAET